MQELKPNWQTGRGKILNPEGHPLMAVKGLFWSSFLSELYLVNTTDFEPLIFLWPTGKHFHLKSIAKKMNFIFNNWKEKCENVLFGKLTSLHAWRKPTNNLTEKAVTRPGLWHISLSGYQRVLTGPRPGHRSITALHLEGADCCCMIYRISWKWMACVINYLITITSK